MWSDYTLMHTDNTDSSSLEQPSPREDPVHWWWSSVSHQEEPSIAGCFHYKAITSSTHTHKLCAQTQMYTFTLLTTHNHLCWCLFLTCPFNTVLCSANTHIQSSSPVPSFHHHHHPLSCSASHGVKPSSPPHVAHCYLRAAVMTAPGPATTPPLPCHGFTLDPCCKGMLGAFHNPTDTLTLPHTRTVAHSYQHICQLPGRSEQGLSLTETHTDRHTDK